MKNFEQDGKVLTVNAPYALASGAGCLVGSLFGVATAAALINTEVEIRFEGVFTLARTTGASTAWAVGDRIYWDDTNKLCTKTASTNKLIGVAVAAAVDGAATGTLRLSAAFTI
jgi:predicted RecA/RadA family phage recombinase